MLGGTSTSSSTSASSSASSSSAAPAPPGPKRLPPQYERPSEMQHSRHVKVANRTFRVWHGATENGP